MLSKSHNSMELIQGGSTISGVDTRLADSKPLAENGRRGQDLFSAINIHEAIGHIENRISKFQTILNSLNSVGSFF